MVNGRNGVVESQLLIADQPVACATSIQLLPTCFCKVASTLAWQPSQRSILAEVGAGQEFVTEQFAAIVLG